MIIEHGGIVLRPKLDCFLVLIAAFSLFLTDSMRMLSCLIVGCCSALKSPKSNKENATRSPVIRTLRDLLGSLR